MGEGGVEVDWFCFYYFVRNSLVALLETLYARIFSLDSWISVCFLTFFCFESRVFIENWKWVSQGFVVVVRSLTNPFFRLSQGVWVNNDWCGLMKQWRLRRERLTQHQTSQGSWDLTDSRPTIRKAHGSRVKVNDTSPCSISNTTSGETAQNTWIKATNNSRRNHRNMAQTISTGTHWAWTGTASRTTRKRTTPKGYSNRHNQRHDPQKQWEKSQKQTES